MEPIILIDEDDDEGFLSEIAVAKPKINQNPKTSPNQPNWNSGKPIQQVRGKGGFGLRRGGVDGLAIWCLRCKGGKMGHAVRGRTRGIGGFVGSSVMLLLVAIPIDLVV
ncbi:hypothetical protein ACFE04_026153 [Oxalis oulophora]